MIKAIIFDFDGVIVNNYEQHYQLSEKKTIGLTREEHKNYLINSSCLMLSIKNMAEKPKKEEKKYEHHHSSGGMGFGTEVILFIVIIFIIWILSGGSKKPAQEAPLITPNINPSTSTN